MSNVFRHWLRAEDARRGIWHAHKTAAHMPEMWGHGYHSEYRLPGGDHNKRGRERVMSADWHDMHDAPGKVSRDAPVLLLVRSPVDATGPVWLPVVGYREQNRWKEVAGKNVELSDRKPQYWTEIPPYPAP
jgi:hypothetical protein